jgi:hypothetical protein
MRKLFKWHSISSTITAWFAIAAGIAAILALIFLALFFAIGRPWGSLNDAFIALEAILSAALAWTMYSTFRTGSPAMSLFGLIAAGIGALVISQKTVRNHVSNIFNKLQVADRAQAIVRARDAGLG